MIAEALEGTRIGITGSTGFLGTALVERLLRSAPGCELVLLIRPGRRATAARRAQRELFKNDAFDRLRSELTAANDGDKKAFDEMVERRVTVVAGDVSTDGLGLSPDDLAMWRSCDTIIHSAATVSFDSALDTAVEIDLCGPSRVAAAIQPAAAPTTENGERRPHLVAVSTCYVAGSRRGRAPEELVADSEFFVDVPWEREVAAARRARADHDAASREPKKLADFASAARNELGAAGTPALAAKTETLRTDWVSEQMVEAGRARADSLGWPDAYAYTKALGEKALGEFATSAEAEGRGIDVSIVRPSIIESAMAEPIPGWIRGFRMAEPVLISYARGLLKAFPGVPEGVVDVIPVDMVVAAICAVAARGPDPEHPVVQVASGSANPLKYERLVELTSGWFRDNPIYDSSGRPITPAGWSFPGRGKVESQLARTTKALAVAEKGLGMLPLRGRQTRLGTEIATKRELAETAGGYVELYGKYSACEAIYSVDRLLDLWHTLDEADQAAFCFNPAAVEWDHYVTETHLPTVVQQARVKMTPGSSNRVDRSERLRKQVLAPERQLAAFDLENTLIASNVVTSYAWLATRQLGPGDRARFTAKTLLEVPRLLALDNEDRSDFLRHFYRRYEGAPVDQLDEHATELFNHLIMAKAFPAAIRRVRAHRAAGHRTVLITGALEFVVRPLAPLFDDIIAAEMGTEMAKGRSRRSAPKRVYTGQLTATPPTGETRAQALADYAAEHDIDLSESVAYADSSSDLPLFEAVGFPVAVNPETKLAGIARKRGWLVEQFDPSPGSPRKLLPMAPALRQKTPTRKSRTPKEAI